MKMKKLRYIGHLSGVTVEGYGPLDGGPIKRNGDPVAFPENIAESLLKQVFNGELQWEIATDKGSELKTKPGKVKGGEK